MSKFCTKCGASIEDSVRFCPDCGAEVTVSAPEPAAPQAQPMQQAPVYDRPVQQQIYQQPMPQYQTPPPPMPQYQQPASQYQQPMAPTAHSTGGVGTLIFGLTLVAAAMAMLIWGQTAALFDAVNGEGGKSYEDRTTIIASDEDDLKTPVSNVTVSNDDPFAFDAPEGVQKAVNKNDFDPDSYLVKYTGTVSFVFEEDPAFEELGITSDGIKVYKSMNGKSYDVTADKDDYRLAVICPGAPVAEFMGDELLSLYLDEDKIENGVYTEEYIEDEGDHMINDSQKVYFMNDGTLHIRNVMRVERNGKVTGGLVMVIELIPVS